VTGPSGSVPWPPIELAGAKARVLYYGLNAMLIS
jgi:hypothetical protein